MKITHIDLTGTFNEELTYQENLLIKHHALEGHVVTMVTTCFRWNKGEMEHVLPVDRIIQFGIRLIRLEYKRILNNYITIKLRKVRKLSKLLNELSPDILFVHCPQTLELLTVRKYVKQHPEVRLYIDNHADYYNSVPNWFSKYILHKTIWRFCVGRIKPFTRRFYGVTPLRVSFLKEMYNLGNDQVELLVMGADDSQIDFEKKEVIRAGIRKNLDISGNDLVLVTGGKIDERKNIHLLLKAFHNISNPEIKLIILGTFDNHVEAVVSEYIHDNRIKLAGWVESEKIYEYFFASDLAVFPGTHSVLWEQAVGSGLPCIFKFWKETTHIDLGGNCLFLHNDSATEIEQLIRKLIDLPDQLGQMKQIAIEKGIKKFSYSEIARTAIQLA